MNENEGEKRTICKCPYCEGEIMITSDSDVICQPCTVNIVSCPKCGEPMREGLERCPSCGESA